MNVEADDLLLERPVVATALVAFVAAVAYGGIQLVLDGHVDPLETGMFVVVFSLVYVGGSRVLRARAADESRETDDGGDDSI